MNFGYVESQRVSRIIVRHLYGGFGSVRAGITNFGHYILENLYGDPSLEGFENYLYELPTNVASGGIGDQTWDSEHCNGEQWWAWDSMEEIYPLLPYFYENNLYCMSCVIIRYLNVDRIKTKKLKKDLTASRQEEGAYLWKLKSVMVPCI